MCWAQVVQPFPDRIWLAQREYERFDGIEYVESIIVHESMIEAFRRGGYKITAYVSAASVSGIVHAASATGRVAGKPLDMVNRGR